MIHLDTCFLIRAMVPGDPADTALRRWLSDGEAVSMSTIAWTEFLCGPVHASHSRLAVQLLAEVAPFVEEDAVLAARLFNDIGRRRGTLVDCMIAASALRGGAELATTNPKHFARLTSHGLVLACI